MSTNLEMSTDSISDGHSYAQKTPEAPENNTSTTPTGTSGNLILTGSGGSTLTGGAGDDTLIGAAGNNTLIGGTGTNTFKVESGTDTLENAVPERDHINVSNGSTAVLNLTSTSANFSTSNTANSGTLEVHAAPTGSTITGSSSGDDVLVGGAGDDTLIGGAGNNILSGGAGNNILIGGSGTNTFNADAGGKDTLENAVPERDHINVSSGSTAVLNLTSTSANFSTSNTANSGTLVINALPSTASTITGSSGNDEIHGGTGDDTLTGGAGGHDILFGGGGVNTFKVQAGEATLADAKPGQDHIEIAHGAKAVQNLTTTTADYSANTVNNGTLVINAPQAGAATIKGSSGNDEIHVGAGNETIDGGGGINTAVYSTNSANATITPSGSGLVVKDASGVNGTDTLTNVQRLHFADTKIAMDIDGHAGITAKILGAVFGEKSLSNAVYAGIGLSDLDNGMSYDSLMQVALNAAGATTSSAEVNLLWTNLFHAAPTAAQAKPYIDMLDSGSTTAAALGIMAADTSFNAANINLVGLHQTGIHYV